MKIKLGPFENGIREDGGNENGIREILELERLLRMLACTLSAYD
jgi:hypothetical protein